MVFAKTLCPATKSITNKHFDKLGLVTVSLSLVGYRSPFLLRAVDIKQFLSCNIGFRV